MTGPPRSLIQLNPTPDESLASLIQRHGSLTGFADTREYLRTLNQDGRRYRPEAIPLSSRWTSWSHLPEHPREFAQLLGLTETQVVEATLQPWEGSVLADDLTPGTIAAAGVRNHHSYCGRCLGSVGWQKSWLLPAVTDCVRHHTILCDACPHCESPVAPLETTRVGDVVSCRRCGFRLTDTTHVTVEDREHITQQRLRTAIASDRDPRGHSIRRMCAFLDRAIPLMTQIGTHISFDTGLDERWDTTYRFDLHPTDRPASRRCNGRKLPGFARNLSAIDPDPKLRRVLVHHAHLAWRDDDYRDSFADIISDIGPTWVSDRLRDPDLHDRFSHKVVPPFLKAPFDRLRCTRALPAWTHVPAVIPFWEVNPGSIRRKLWVRSGATLSALMIAAIRGADVHTARAMLGIPDTLKLVAVDAAAVDAAIHWFKQTPKIDFAERRRTLAQLDALTEEQWRQRTRSEPPTRGDPRALAALFWTIATCGAPSMYPHTEVMTDQSRGRFEQNWTRRSVAALGSLRTTVDTDVPASEPANAPSHPRRLVG